MGSQVSGVNSADHLWRLRVEMADAHAGDAEFRRETPQLNQALFWKFTTG